MNTFTWACEDCGASGTMRMDDMCLWDNAANLHQASHVSSVFDPMPKLMIGETA